MQLKPWARTRFVIFLAFFYLILCFFQRVLYVGWIHWDHSALPEGIALALLKGITFDLAVCGYLFLPVSLALISLRGRCGSAARGLALFLALSPIVVGLLSIAFELFFWEEFRSRYNFIAVDYLVYTHEVVRNIWESYPVVWFFLGMSLIFGTIAWALRRKVHDILHAPTGWKERGALLCCMGGLITLNSSIAQDRWLETDSVWGRELAKNSLYALFSAYNSNEIEYKKFYLSLGQTEAKEISSRWLGASSGNLFREIRHPGPEKKWNVMLVAIESMSARFLQHYGSDKNITPNLDRFAKEGLFFRQIYATGSRTVRGLEALMLSLPPTPGQSILRRPKSDKLFNLGTVFRSRGYDTQFVYGGLAAFDNMGPWFSSNGFEIVDKAKFSPGGVTFSTAWGACDEDLFDESIRRADASSAAGKNFFQVILTTSNHRPYDFPEGRIDIKSHTGRDGAVKYTDFAIGRFVEQARKKSWFNNTLFVFVADHNASVAGGTEIPIADYLIPVIFYNPGLVKPQVSEKLGSQIDVAPTLLSLLGFSYRSWFFGQNLMQHEGGRAFLGTYQKVALLEPGRMVILEPNRRALIQQLNPNGTVKNAELFRGSSTNLPEEIRRTVAVYQSAAELFAKGLSKEKAANAE